MVVRNVADSSQHPRFVMTEVRPVATDAAEAPSASSQDADGPGGEAVASIHSAEPVTPHDTQGKDSAPRGFIPPALQGCLRCDACSCIYLDELDYYKHVRNYHSAAAQKRLKRSSSCRTCVFSKIEPDQVTTLKSLQQQHRIVSPIKINVLQNNVKSRWSRMFGSRLRGQMTPLSAGLRAIDPARVPLKAKVKMQAGLQPFVVQELDAKMSAMKRQRAANINGSSSCPGDSATEENADLSATNSAAYTKDASATPGSDGSAAVASQAVRSSEGLGGQGAEVDDAADSAQKLDQTVVVKQEPVEMDETLCAALLQQVEVRIKTEPDS